MQVVSENIKYCQAVLQPKLVKLQILNASDKILVIQGSTFLGVKSINLLFSLSEILNYGLWRDLSG